MIARTDYEKLKETKIIRMNWPFPFTISSQAERNELIPNILEKVFTARYTVWISEDNNESSCTCSTFET